MDLLTTGAYLGLDRDRIVRAARHLVETHYPGARGNSGACLLHGAAMVAVLGGLKVRAVLQAGSASWPRLLPDQDDGLPTTLTHFSYVFEPGSEMNRQRLLEDKLPEMHVWAAVPETQEIIDTSTRDWVVQCKTLTGMDWPGEAPPDYLWCPAMQLPAGVSYRPDREAVKIALSCLHRLHRV